MDQSFLPASGAMPSMRLPGTGQSTIEAGMFLPIAKRSRRINQRLGGRLKAKFKAKNNRRRRQVNPNK
jgi:hypothetical protein